MFVIKKVKNLVWWIYVNNDFHGEEVFGMFYEKRSQETNQKKFKVEKVVKRKGDKLYIKRKGYDN